MYLWIQIHSQAKVCIGIVSRGLAFRKFIRKILFFCSIYSHQGASHKGSYQYTLTTNDNDTYSFVGIDLCPRPGAGRPFNFLGHISEVF